MFEPAWSARTAEDDPGAPFFNDTTKYVVSSTLTDPTWRNTELLGRYDAETVRRLKEDVDGDLYVSGSGKLVQARLFPEGARPATFTLAATEGYANGAVYLAYAPNA